ncbi:hypothetical protein CRUP_026074, partial [Coryphaenoides rupestris]
MGNGSLQIRHVLEEDRGFYLCQASNGKGHVKELNCTARGEWPIIIRWERGDTVIDPDRNPRYSIITSPNEKTDEVLSTLRLKPAERGDSVFFSCHAINSYGEGRGLIQLTVQEPPDPPELEVREVKDRSMNLRWTQRFDGNSIITSYDIEYKNKTDTWELKHSTRNISPTNNQANIVDLHPASVYSIRMYSYNAIGKSEASKELTISTEEAQPDGPPMEVILEAVTSQSIRVTWKAPRKELQNGVIRGYQIGYRENGPGSNGQYSIVEMKATGDSEVYTLDNLKKFAQYGVVVQAFNRAGTGPSSSEINATTLEDVPSQPPQNVRAISVTSDEAVITWSEPPRMTLHGVLKGYRVVFWAVFPDGGGTTALRFRRGARAHHQVDQRQVRVRSISDAFTRRHVHVPSKVILGAPDHCITARRSVTDGSPGSVTTGGGGGGGVGGGGGGGGGGVWRGGGEGEVRLPCGSVGEPAPTIKWTKDSEDTAIPVSVDGQRLIMANGTLALRTVKAEDSGYYTCTATNTLGFDTIIVNLVVQVPPDQPRLTVSTTSTSSITLAWIPGDNGGSSIRAGQPACGTWYKVKLAAKNSVGAGRIARSSRPRPTAAVRHLGSHRAARPWEPQFNKEQSVFTHINSSHARLNLQGWASGGCPINAITLEFRPKGTWAWQTVRTNVSADVFLAELREATWYELKMKACNSAGCGNQSSQFATLDYDGRYDPAHQVPLEKNDDVKKLFSIGCPVILVTLGVALLFIIRKKRKEKRLKRLRGEEDGMTNNRSFDTPVKGLPQGPRLHIDIPRVQLLIEDKEGIKQIGEDKATIPVTDTEFAQTGNPQSFCTGVSVHHPALIQNTGPLIDMSDIRPGTNPVSRKSVKSAHSIRNRYSSQWTLTKCQASTPARTLTSDWRTVGSQHGITVTESDSYSASLSQDTVRDHRMTTGTNDNADSMTSMSTPSEPGICRFTASPPKPQDYDRGKNVAVPIPHRAKSEWCSKPKESKRTSDYCNLPLYMKSDPFFRKQSEHHDPCPVVPPREASIRGLAQRAYHTQGRHVTMDSAKQQQQQSLTMGHSGPSSLTSSSGTSSGGQSAGAAGGGGASTSSSCSTLPQRTLTMPGSSASAAQSAAAAAAAMAAAAAAAGGASGSSSSGGATGATAGALGGPSTSSSKMGGSRDSLLESSSSGLGRLQKQRGDGGAGAYSKSYT